MTTLTLTHVPPRDEPLTDFLAAIAESARRHLHAQVVTHNVLPPRFELVASEVQVRSFARVWLDAHGVEWDVTPGGGEVGTGAGRGDDRVNATEATSWVNGSRDCPEAPAQAHLPAIGGAA